ncbi:MAG TPA: hypothetical protein PKY72_05460 [Bacilli bacterium]|nr:hypothetical protein [Bacilli bacterium]
MIYKVKCTDKSFLEVLKTRFNINTEEFYLRGASLSEDLETWSNPDFDFVVTLYTVLETDEEETILFEPTDIEDTRPALETVVKGEGTLKTLDDVLTELNWSIDGKHIVDENKDKVMMFGVSATFPILAFSEKTQKGVLFVDSYMIIQDRNNFSVYNMEVNAKLLPLTGELFTKYYVLVKGLFEELKPINTEE